MRRTVFPCERLCRLLHLMLNERDGGICLAPGQCAKLKIVFCETEYNTQKGVECYEKTKGEVPSGALPCEPMICPPGSPTNHSETSIEQDPTIPRLMIDQKPSIVRV